MAASPEFYRPSAPAFPPCASPLAGADDEYTTYRTPSPGLKEPAACPPAPRKPKSAVCRKLNFDPARVVTLRLDELERLFRPMPPQPQPQPQRLTACSPDKKPRLA
ncbi:hypothetical protein GUJ93_ZPchr0006g45306 [Zizania palustris]|uniref:Uncharacterized protein n=1 Tax=Zizania palustris TaxID=103762 RepID=A0A8J5T3S8_ZIZPA|nr:hypothetical protein GUJ93_ZPchr0006g45306 [Zizania palustris]